MNKPGQATDREVSNPSNIKGGVYTTRDLTYQAVTDLVAFADAIDLAPPALRDTLTSSFKTMQQLAAHSFGTWNEAPDCINRIEKATTEVSAALKNVSGYKEQAIAMKSIFTSAEQKNPKGITQPSKGGKEVHGGARS